MGYRQLSVVSILALLLSGCETVTDVQSSITGLFSSKDQGVPEQANATHATSQVAVASRTDVENRKSGTSTVSGVLSPNDVIDGDTIKLQGHRIRLHGIDAPELNQPCTIRGEAKACGIYSRNALIGFTAGATVVCKRMDVDRYGRDVSVCHADGFDVSGGLVSAGLAVAYRQYSEAYVSQETRAKEGKRGMWKGSFTMPWEWRAHRS